MYLGEIIKRLKKEDPARIIPLGWNGAYSWRGNYSELAVNPATKVTVGTMLAVLDNALGSTFAGYKGGEFRMSDCTEVYLDRWGEADGNRIGVYLLEFILGNTPKP